MPDARPIPRHGDTSGFSTLSEELPPPLRLAVVYAPQRARLPWTAVLALDRRLARMALGGEEAMLGQLRLAWWRDRFREPAASWPAGEPLFAALASLDRERAALEALVDGWEALAGGVTRPADLHPLVEARAEAIVALARALGCTTRFDAIARMARAWAAADLARRIPVEFADELAAVPDAPAVRLPREMRPLAILCGLSRWRDLRQPQGPRLRALLGLVRLGLTGR